ncbi:helix-turn-helix domain-containing protein [Streptomyces sp. NPDC046831]|uniref:TetR/AcrR family transcriptional regulator n=1 Tax=Streptomyces sp. NPDC046831 TaxID=3154805 RepID=UPI0033C88599
MDAARNRQAILVAASALFDQPNSAEVSMQEIAAAAGVGKGTVFRRFGDRTRLIQAVLLPRVATLRSAVESGPPPLGPGGSPDAALVSLVEALFDFAWRNRPLIRALEVRGPHAYYTNEASQFWIAELTRRLAAAAPGTDAEFRAHAVFTALRADVIEYMVDRRGMTRDRIRSGLAGLLGLPGWPPAGSP